MESGRAGGFRRALAVVALGLAGCGARTGLDPYGVDAGIADATDAADASDAPMDASVDVAEPPTGPLRAAVLNVNTRDCFPRLATALDSTVESTTLIPLDAALSELVGYHLVILCGSWAEDGSTRDRVLARSGEVTAYVEQGGGLVVFQPNSLERVPLTLLPATFIVEAGFTYNDGPVIVAPRHPVVAGLTESDVPYPTDKLLSAPEWSVLVRGAQSGNASLAVLELGAGRVALDLGQEGLDMGPDGQPRHSDRFLAQMSSWLMRLR